MIFVCLRADDSDLTYPTDPLTVTVSIGFHYCFPSLKLKSRDTYTQRYARKHAHIEIIASIAGWRTPDTSTSVVQCQPALWLVYQRCAVLTSVVPYQPAL